MRMVSVCVRVCVHECASERVRASECMCVCVSAVTQRDKTRQHKPLEEIEGEVRCIDIMNYEAMVKCMSIQK